MNHCRDDEEDEIFQNQDNGMVLSQENGMVLSQENETILSQENGTILSQENGMVLSQDNEMVLSQDEMTLSQENGIILSQSQNQQSKDQIDLEKIYEFNEDEFDDDLNNGFQLNRSIKIQQDYSIKDSESEDSTLSNESIVDELNEVKQDLELNHQLIDQIRSSTSGQIVSNYADLNDYCWYDIFKLLSLIELQQCRIVCKRWRFLIDSIKIKKLSLTYFSKYSWSSNENFENLQQYCDSIDVSSLESVRQILMKEQFQDLEHLSLVTEYSTNNALALNSRQFVIDVSIFSKLKKLELSGSCIQLKENQVCATLTHLRIEQDCMIDPMKLFPNLIYLKTNFYNSNTCNLNLKELEYFGLEHNALLQGNLLFQTAPNLSKIFCDFENAYRLIELVSMNTDEFPFKKLETIKIYFDSYVNYELRFHNLILTCKNLKIQLEFHVNIAKAKTKGDLIKWNKLFIGKRIYTVYYDQKRVNLRDLLLLPRYENNTMLKQSLRVDRESLLNIDDKVYQYMFNTNTLVLRSDNMEAKFNELLKKIPCITRLTIEFRLSKQTFDRIKFNCPYLSHLVISTKQAYKLDLNFIHYLDHLTSIDLFNVDLINCSIIQNKIKFSKFFHVVKFRNCNLLDEDYSQMTKAMVEKAQKNPGKFYEIHMLPVQQYHIAKFNQQFFADAPENFYSNLFRFQS